MTDDKPPTDGEFRKWIHARDPTPRPSHYKPPSKAELERKYWSTLLSHYDPVRNVVRLNHVAKFSCAVHGPTNHVFRKDGAALRSCCACYPLDAITATEQNIRIS